MRLPIDVKAVLDEAVSLDKALAMPLSVSIYMDESSPGDIQAFVRRSFASAASNTRVSTMYFPSFPVVVSPEADMAVIVAGVNEDVGSYAAEIRQSGVPVMVVSSMPGIAYGLSQQSSHLLLKEDLIGPGTGVDERALTEISGLEKEPYALTPAIEQELHTKMGEWIIETCKEKRLAFALAFGFVRRPLSVEAVKATSLQNAGVGLVLVIPGADMPVMTLNQAKMLLQIAAAYGQPMNMERVKELAAVVGGGFAFRSIARQAIGVVPALGWAIKAAVGYSGTYAMGHAAIEYFEKGGDMDGVAAVASKAREAAAKAVSAVPKHARIQKISSRAVQKIKGDL